MQANDIRKGQVIIFEGDLCKVMEFRHHTPGNLRAMVQAKLRNMRTGNQFEHRFRSQDPIEPAYITQHEMEYLYSDGHAHHFMNTANYEQVEIGDQDLGDAASWLAPGLKIQVQFHEQRPIGRGAALGDHVGEEVVANRTANQVLEIQVVCMNPQDSTFNRSVGRPVVSIWTR